MPVTNSGNDIAREPVAVLGAGSWGTALAIQFARAGHPTRLWCRNEVDAAQMIAEQGSFKGIAAKPSNAELNKFFSADMQKRG